MHIDGDSAATRTADDYIRLVPVVFGMSDKERRFKVVVGKFGVEDGVNVLRKVGRFQR